MDEGDDEEARRQDVLIANLRGEHLRLVRELQSLFELVGPVEAKTYLVQGLRFLVPVPELSGYLEQALMGFDGGMELAQEEMDRPFAGIDRHPGRRLHGFPKPLTHVQRPAIVLAGFWVSIGL